MAKVLLGRFPRVEGEELRLALVAMELEVEVRGEARAALEGMLPAGDVGLELWVEEAMLARAQGVQKDVERERSAPVATQPRSRPPVFAVLFFLTSVVLAVLLWRERHPPAQDSGPVTWSDDPGGRCTTGRYQGHVFQRSCDRNRDGNWEQIDQFDRQGKLLSTSLDEDEDGFAERITSYDVQGHMVSRSDDVDGDWRFDRSEQFDLDEHPRSRSFDEDHDGRVDRLIDLDSRGDVRSITTWHGDDFNVAIRLDGGLVTERSRGDSLELVLRDGGVQVLTVDGWR